jgi:Mn2+/Fe2+ NRAMP family transporter
MYEVGSLASRYAEEKREQRKAVRRFVWDSMFALVTIALYVELAIMMGAAGSCFNSFY